MIYKSCYFVRNTAPGEALDLTKSGETDLLFGELGKIDHIRAFCTSLLLYTTIY